jgi:hypothetical protein
MALTLPARNCAGDRLTATVRYPGQVAAVFYRQAYQRLEADEAALQHSGFIV